MPIFIYRHSHIKLEHGIRVHLIIAQLGASIVQIIQYLTECGMTEDWKVMRNAAEYDTLHKLCTRYTQRIYTVTNHTQTTHYRMIRIQNSTVNVQ